MKNGYNGKALFVDLTTSTLTIEKPDDAIYRKYMGGSALNLHYLLNHMPAGVHPLSPENVLAFSVGVTTGTRISGQSRMCVNAKSPLTDAIGDSQCGGSLPAKMKWSGFDSIIFKGKAEIPVYLWIDDGKAELRDASHLWGKDTSETESQIRQELEDEKIEIALIGPAGENQVLYAAIMNMRSRANGRTGMGAVMGSKNLKAVAFRGTRKPTLADKPALISLAKWGAKQFPESMVKVLGKFGTANAVSAQQAQGGLPTRNFASGCFDTAEKISGATMYATTLVGASEGKQDRKGRETCYACVIRCKRVVEIKDGPFPVDPQYGGPEYETCATFGSYCAVDNLAAVSKANEICNQYGQDTIACGATIAWAMDCFAAGILTREDTGGLEIKFGDAEMMVKLVKMIVDREGFGNILADGSAKAARKLGKGSELLITCKGSETPAHMPTNKRSLALIYAVNPFGADHESSEHDIASEAPSFENFKERQNSLGLMTAQPPKSLGPGKVDFARKTQQFYSFMDSVGLCMFAWGSAWQLYGPQQAVELVQAVTGWDVTMEELLTVGERR
ncbi:MAG: aldehyde ferredoxin oxidoreductase family protein, partial [Deltaproteobacteria bacterium]|nr:aldehyde ferredoxin oxidoreductase family protein [Deltaproteobacteria bacterium]